MTTWFRVQDDEAGARSRLGVLLDRLRDRLVGSDPGLVRLRLAVLAAGGIVASILVLGLAGRPIPTIIVAGIVAMQAAFTVTDPEPRDQAVTLVAALLSGAAAMTCAAFGSLVPPLDGVLFVLLIFFAVYARRFGPRGMAMGSVAFFVFFFALFLGIEPAQLPGFLPSIAIGLAANAVLRFLVWPRRPDKELLRIRVAFRARLSEVLRAAASYLVAGDTTRARNRLNRADERLHESVMMIEEALGDALQDQAASDLLRRRAIEVELAAQWLSITTRRTCAADLPAATRDELVLRLLRLDALVEHDPRQLPVIVDTEEFSRVLVAGSRLAGEQRPGDDLRRAVAELALADVNAQRIAERDYSAEERGATTEDTREPKPRLFVYDNRTRSAVQAMIAGGLAVLGGELVSPQRWYWAVLTVFVVFLGTDTAGATFVKGIRRTAGTVAGIFGGMLLAIVVAGDHAVAVVMIIGCLFVAVYLARVSHVVMSFFITCLLGVLYSLLGTFTIDVLWLRVAETAVGAAAGMLAATLALPVRTRTKLREDVGNVLRGLRDFLEQAAQLLSGRESVNVLELSRALDREVETARTTIEPLTHPISLGNRRSFGSYVLTTLEGIAFRTRHVAARAEPGLLAADDRITDLIDRITGNVDVLLKVVDGTETQTTRTTLTPSAETPVTRDGDTGPARSVISSFGHLDALVIALGRAWEVPVDDRLGTTRPGASAERPE